MRCSGKSRLFSRYLYGYILQSANYASCKRLEEGSWMPEISLFRHRIKDLDHQTKFVIILSEKFLLNPE